MEEPDPADTLPWTGERLVTSCAKPIAYEHLHRYAIACTLAKGKRVLDIACGEGYGSRLLARTGAHVIGVDNDATAISHAQRKYQRQNLKFVQGSCTSIPCDDSSIDLVACFETIEHIDDHEGFLREIKRVLAPGGILIISSPDKAEYSGGSTAANPFHVRELFHAEFAQLLAGVFDYRLIGKQRLVAGSWVAPDAPEEAVAAVTFRGTFDEIETRSGVDRGMYSIAVCSDETLPPISFGVFEDFTESADVWNLLGMYETSANVARLFAQSQEKMQNLAAVRAPLEQLEKTNAAQAAELLETQWELLTLREASLRSLPETPAVQLADVEGRLETASTERDEMREMVKQLQQDLDSARVHIQELEEELEATNKASTLTAAARHAAA